MSKSNHKRKKPVPQVRCTGCGGVYEPNLKARFGWRCPVCQAKNPNLMRHYRCVADMWLYGVLLDALYLFGVGIVPTFDFLITAVHLILFALTIIYIFKSRAPWSDQNVNRLIWVSFSCLVIVNVLKPLLSGEMPAEHPLLWFCLICYLYLRWLNTQSGRIAVHSMTYPKHSEVV